MSERPVLHINGVLAEGVDAVRRAEWPKERAEACAALARVSESIADGVAAALARSKEFAADPSLALPSPLDQLADRADEAYESVHAAVQDLRDVAIQGSMTLRDSRQDVLREASNVVARFTDLANTLKQLDDDASRLEA